MKVYFKISKHHHVNRMLINFSILSAYSILNTFEYHNNAESALLLFKSIKFDLQHHWESFFKSTIEQF